MNLDDYHFFYSLIIAAINDNYAIKISFLFSRLFGENVAVISVSSLHFSSPGEHKAFFGCGVGFNFGHCYKNLVKQLFLFYWSNHHYHPLTFQFGHLLCLSVVLKFESKSKEKFLSLLREKYRTSSEEDVGLHF